MKAEALAEAAAEAKEMRAEAASMLADATAEAQRTESETEIALGAVASIAASHFSSLIKGGALFTYTIDRSNCVSTQHMCCSCVD